ncbi:MAG: roadblock/LC7 domain-containing protein [Methanomicrobia archaeon]|nr:roadblock/LC7 domain-containing protein [Methanomicrobia archaeon]
MKKELLDGVLAELKKTVNVEASAIVTRSGLLISGDLPEDIGGETFAAMSATILGAAETATMEIKNEIPERVIVETEKRRVITVGAGEKALIVCITSDPDLKLVLSELKKAAEKVREIL